MATSAGLLVFRRSGTQPEFLLAHPGGPFWRKRDAGVWSVPKGLLESSEAPLEAALREFGEETGLSLPGVVASSLTPLTPVRQKGGKVVLCWAAEADLDLVSFTSGEFEMEWPPRSGRTARFPEVDQLRYFPADEALAKILPAQAPLIHEARRGVLTAQ